ncbi:sensor histidine kinase [Streptomyces sp. NPDC059650]|uniref:sensor histidine kinase n=1 Tax=Streptomyces sp. NPDC059650 TaxID=3346896 RepID=UPI0036C42E97
MSTIPARAVSWARARRGPALGAAALASTVIVFEALDTGFLPTIAATIVAGLLCVTALLAPPQHLWSAGWAAVTTSAALSLATTGLQHRPEHTHGLAEMCALLLLVTRSIRHQPVRRMIPLAIAAWAATPLMLLRLPASQHATAAKYAVPPLLLAALVMVVLGLYLRLLDASREREKNTRLHAQRLEYARELHDFVGHHITAMTAQVKAVRFTTAAGHPPTPQALDEALANIEDAGTQAMDSMRAMVGLLRRPDHEAPLEAPQGLNALQDLAEPLRAAGIAVSLTVDPRLDAAPPADHTSSLAHHIVREALTNVRKHAAQADTVTIDVRLSADNPGTLTVCVTDNGPRNPANTPSHQSGGGFGIVGLRERVHALGGTLTAGAGPASGWQVLAQLPAGRNHPQSSALAAGTMAP